VPAPRFHRVAALQRRFVDREPVLAAFAAELSRIGAGPRVFNVTGVGGIGKSRLLHELKHRAATEHRTATLDLQVPALRQQEDALAVLRTELGAQGVTFDRLDIAYAVLWQRLHPHLRLSASQLSFVDDSSVLTDIVDAVAGVPVFATARGLIRLLERGGSDVRRRLRVGRDQTLGTLDDLPNSELSDAVTYLFAQDLRAASADRPYVVVVDSYEALVPAPVRGGRSHLADEWLRDLVAQLDRGLVVVASREPLGWERGDPDWAEIIRVTDVEGLPPTARLELLSAGGVTEPAQARAIADASAGLPFYLNLAIDTHQQAGPDGGTVVSQEQILGRFLQHVTPEEIRVLEVLSPARVFDHDVFRLVTAAFDLPGHRLAWESLTAYSFVYPAAGGSLRFHQLMSTALRARLSDQASAEVHALLHAGWAARAEPSTGRDAGPAGARALREAAHHGVLAGRLAGADLLELADRAVHRGGHSAATGIADDLQEFLAARPERSSGDDGQAGAEAGELPDALRCLRAEAAVRLGDAGTVTALTNGDVAASRGPVGARLAVAAGHGRRIAGRTGAALEVFEHVWRVASGAPRLRAGLWAADLHMAQGRFLDAEALAAAVDALAPAQDAELRGDVARLRHLAHRFALDPTAAGRHLDEAADHYAAGDFTLGLANVQTNRAELAALRDPTEAIAEAGRAIEIQREIGAHHELGKAYTALAVGHLRLGRLDEAAASLQTAFAALDRAGYRSGLARARFYQAFLDVRRGRVEEATAALRGSVAELEAADVYPTIVLGAAHLLGLLGIEDPEVSAAARRARDAVQPFGTLADLDQRIAASVADLLDGRLWRPGDLHRDAASRTDQAASGYYNHNVEASTPTGDVIVRMPIPGSDVMDLRIWPEHAVLRAIRGTITLAPRLLYAQGPPHAQGSLHAQGPPGYMVVELVAGWLLDDDLPPGSAVPDQVIDDVAALFGQLGSVPRERLPPLPEGWPGDGDTAGFARGLSAITGAVHDRFRPEFGDLFDGLGIPADPLGPIEDRWATLRPRTFRLLHTDVHRKNIIISGGHACFLDWELALWGDPLYDLAVHLHKMGYPPPQASAIVSGWLAAVPESASVGWRPDLETYLTHERVKSAIVDTVRYTKIITAPECPAAQRDALVERLVGKLAAARTALNSEGSSWGTSELVDPPTAATLIHRWAQRGRP
jgi:aminoglycoside phosphotransferase (APT) family kinase protein/tetratricopeptide (TPR) repeat protein